MFSILFHAEGKAGNFRTRAVSSNRPLGEKRMVKNAEKMKNAGKFTKSHCFIQAFRLS
jgi:hypothetical protein